MTKVPTPTVRFLAGLDLLGEDEMKAVGYVITFIVSLWFSALVVGWLL